MDKGAPASKPPPLGFPALLKKDKTTIATG
jgi:hypothetical protein